MSSPYSPQSGIYLPVYSYETSTSPLHVRTFLADAANESDVQKIKSWDFPASYTGHRSVCWLPGATSDMAFMAWVGGDNYTPGDPFGFTPAASASNVQAIALTRTSVITPRIKLWTTDSSDRKAVFGSEPDQPSESPITATVPTSDTVRVRVVRLLVHCTNGEDYDIGVKVVADKIFRRDVRDFICEGDFLNGGECDIDWTSFSADFTAYYIAHTSIGKPVHSTYAIVFGDGDVTRASVEDISNLTAHPILIVRSFKGSIRDYTSRYTMRLSLVAKTLEEMGDDFHIPFAKSYPLDLSTTVNIPFDPQNYRLLPPSDSGLSVDDGSDYSVVEDSDHILYWPIYHSLKRLTVHLFYDGITSENVKSFNGGWPVFRLVVTPSDNPNNQVYNSGYRIMPPPDEHGVCSFSFPCDSFFQTAVPPLLVEFRFCDSSDRSRYSKYTTFYNVSP